MSFPRYEKYKDSDVEWLGKVPEDWESKPLWTLFSRTKRTGNSDEELLSVYRDYGVIPKSSREDNFNKPSDDLTNYQLVEVGDLAINKMKAWQGSVAISGYRGIVSPAYHVYSSEHSQNSRYFHHLFRCGQYITGYLSNSKGIRVNQWDLEPQQHSRMPVLLPPLAEQTQIARFLDHETARIDALIAEQKRLIELLKEKRQAVISHAVTKGLDPTVPLKDSGVEWLGEVPEHWTIMKVKHILRCFEQGWSPQCENEPVENSKEWGVLKVGCVNGGIFSANENKRLPESLDPIPELSVKADDVLISRANTRELVGGAALVELDHPNLMLSDKIFRLRTTNTMSANYLVFYLGTSAVRYQIELEATGASSSMLNIGQSVIKELSIPVPPKVEQHDIVSKLGGSLDRLYCLQQEAILTQQLLQERRSALISAAVTGKIDVRNWQPPVVN